MTPDSIQEITGELYRNKDKFRFEVDIANGVNRLSFATVCPTSFDTEFKVFDSSGIKITDNDDHNSEKFLDDSYYNCSGSNLLSSIPYLRVVEGAKYTIELSQASGTGTGYGEFKVVIAGSKIGKICKFNFI